MKNGKSLFHHVLQRVSCWKKELPDGDCRKVAATIQNVLGPEAEELGRATGVIQRRRKFTAVSLLRRMLVLTLLRKPDAKATDFQSTAAQLGLDVTSTAVENRFTPQLVGFLRAVLEGTVLRVLAASPQTVDLLNKFTSVRIGDSSTIALPDELADQFPGCGGILCAGLAAMKIHLLWDFLTGSILQLRITPGCASDATNPIAQEVAPAGSLSLFDLGYFCLDRFQNLTRAGAFWISGCSMARRSSTPKASPCRCCRSLRQQTGSGPIDVSILLGVSHRMPCRLIALRVPQEVADLRAAVKAHAEPAPRAWPRAVAGVSRMAGLDDLRDQLRAGVADVGGRRRALPLAAAD